MNAERWQQVKTIFHRAVEYDPAVRAQFLSESCGSDPELRREVESLLDSDREPGSLLDRPAVGAGALAAAAPVRGATSMLGRTIGNYVISGELARGGMGIVYRARHVTLPRDAVVKCIRPLAVSDDAQKQLRARFRREAHIQSQLDHPHIVRVYEFFDFAEEYFLVMEFVPGSSVRSMLDSTVGNSGRLPTERAVTFAVHALEGLAHAHGLHFVDESGNTGIGVIHRDIKPANLLVDELGLLKVTDFGIAKVASEGHLTKTGFTVGTVEYMSPEQIRGLSVDARSDLYSLGVTLYQLLAGRVPFPKEDSGSGYDLLKAHVETDPPPIRTVNPEIPAVLADVVTRSLQRDPDQRWQSAAEFREALLACQENRPVLVGFTPPRPIPAKVEHKRRWIIVAAVAVLALVLAAAALWMGRRVGPSIAVLPFADLSPEKNQAYFTEGLTDELLNGLAKTPGLRVAGRTSSFQFKDKTGDFSAIGKKLNVDAILEGTVRKQGNQVRISVHLIKVADGFPMWSGAYNRELNDIFAVQEDIAREVTGTLKVALLGGAPVAKSTNAEAYNAYLLGQYFFIRGYKENLGKAISYFEQATKLDANYAPAWVGLAESRNSQASHGYVPPEEGYRQARQEVQRALSLDPNLAEAYVAMGQIQMLHDWDWTGAQASCQRALTLVPGKASAISLCEKLDRIVGRLDEATALGRRVMQIDPLSAGTFHNAGISLYYAGRYEEAKAVFYKSLELAPEKEITHGMLVQVYLEQSKPQEALAEAEKEKNAGLRLCGLAMANYALGRKQESDRNLAELTANFANEFQVEIAEVHAFRNEPDQAFEWLQRAYDEHDSGISLIKGDPLLKNLEHDPRYTAFLKKMRLL